MGLKKALNYENKAGDEGHARRSKGTRRPIEMGRAYGHKIAFKRAIFLGKAYN